MPLPARVGLITRSALQSWK